MSVTWTDTPLATLAAAGMQVVGVKADGTEDILANTLEQPLEINDTQDQYDAIKIVFPNGYTAKRFDVDLKVDVGMKDDAWESVRENLVNKRADPNWRNWFQHGTGAYKFFNSSEMHYQIEGEDKKILPGKAYLYFTTDYVMVDGWRNNGNHVVVYSLRPETMVREMRSTFHIRKDDNDNYWTDYAKKELGLKRVKYITFLPEGVYYLTGSVGTKSTGPWVRDNPIPEPTIIPNYKDTGKTALIFELGDMNHDRVPHEYFGNYFKYDIQTTNDLREGTHRMEGYYFWEDQRGLVDKWNTHVDTLDFDNDGNTKERFERIEDTLITYTQRKDIVTKNYLSSTQTGNYASTAVLDRTTENPYYKFNLFNNYIEDMQGISMIATLPAKGDTAIAPDQDGNYVARGSDLSLHLKKSLESDPANAGLLAGWDFFYSTDPLGTSIEERKNANWLSADQIDDFSKVTMIKMQQKPGALLRQKQNIDFYAPMALPADMPEVNKMLVASASTAFSTNGNSYIESNKITFSFTPGYQVEGKVFADLNDDGALTGDTLLEGYTVALMNRDGTPVLDADGVALTTQTNAGGSFFFKVPKRGEYYLSLTKKYANDRAAKLYEIDGTRTIGSGGNDAIADDADATAMTLKTELFSLNPYAPSSVDNVYEKPSSFIATRNFGLVPQNGQIKITLHDAENTDKAIPGGVFALYNQQGDELGQFTTDASGVVLSGLLPFATYKIKQLSTTDSYMLPTEEIEFTTSTLIHTVPVFNKIKKAELNISLTAAEDKNLPLANGVYELKDANGKLIATLTTDEKGKANIADLPYGKYTLTQITAPKNYTLSPVVTEIVIDAPSKEYPLTNARKNGTVTLTLKDSRNTKLLLEKGEFAITDTNGNLIATITPDMLVTNKDGTITLPNLPYGDYIIKQTKAPTRYRLNDAPIKVALYDENVDLTHLNQKRPTDTPPPPADPVPDPKPEPTPDPKPTDPIIEIIPQDPKPIEPTTPKGPDFTDPIVYRPVEKPATDTLPATAQPAIKKYVKTLPKTGAIGQAQIDKKAGVVSASARKKIETRLPSEEIFRLAGDRNKSLSHWLAVLPESERVASQYIVLPTQGLVMPVQTVASGSKAYNNFTNGIAEDFASYLHNGAVQLPGVSLGSYGDAGNKVIAGHSSYRKSSKAKYKTHFQKIIGMESGEEIRIYKKTAKGTFIRYVYKVNASYNTDDQDVSVLKPTHADQLTLITCTPIGGVAGRWVVKATFQGH